MRRTTIPLSAALALACALSLSLGPARPSAAQERDLITSPDEAKAAIDTTQTEGPPHTGKFPNKDTAKNRKDVSMGTREPKGTLSIGADEEGSRTMDVIPPKKKAKDEQQQPIYVQPKIQVKP